MFLRSKILTLSLVALASVGIACGVPQDEHDAVQAERDEAIALGERLENDKQSLEQRVTDLEGEHDSANETIDRLETDGAAADEQISELTSERDQISVRVGELEEDSSNLRNAVATLEASQSQLLESIGDVESLESRRDDLELIVDDLLDEIDDLRRARSPLIPETHNGQFLCTGSMDPVITCMDRSIWLDDFAPEDIVIGAVISFDASDIDCRVSSERVAHRVIDIKIESSEYFFLTQGDNNRRDDGCWIPESNVHGYIIELIENDFPEMQAMYDQIWPLEVEEAVLLGEIDELDQEFDDLNAEYNEYLENHCDWNGSKWICSAFQFQRATKLFDALSAVRDTLIAKLDEYYPMCEQIRSLRVELQELRDARFGPSSYVYPSCS